MVLDPEPLERGGDRTDGAPGDVMHPPRVLMVTTVPMTLTGFLLPYAQHLRGRGWQVDAATGAAPEAGTLDADFDQVWQLSWSRSPLGRGNPRALVGMRRALAQGRYDIVHVHTPIASVLTRIAAASLGQRRPAVVYTAHGFHFHQGGGRLRNAVFALAERIAGRWTDRLVVITDEDAGQALQRRIVPGDRLVHLPGIGVDLDYYAPTDACLERARSLREEFGVAADAAVYSMLAEFRPGKNHVSAVRAFAGVPVADKHLFLAGLGPLRDQVAEQVADLGLQDQVHFLDFVKDVRPLVLASDATLLPSWREGLSRAVLESLALGVPVVGGDRRGIRELVQTDVGVLVEPDDIDGLTRALVGVLDLPGRGQLRERTEGRMQRYSLRELLALHDRLYDALLGERNGTASAGTAAPGSAKTG